MGNRSGGEVRLTSRQVETIWVSLLDRRDALLWEQERDDIARAAWLVESANEGQADMTIPPALERNAQVRATQLAEIDELITQILFDVQASAVHRGTSRFGVA